MLGGSTVGLVCEWVQHRSCCPDAYIFRGKVFIVSKREKIAKASGRARESERRLGQTVREQEGEGSSRGQII